MPASLDRILLIPVALVAMGAASASAQPAVKKVPVPTIDATVIVPAQRIVSIGARLKSITERPKPASL